MNIENRLIDLVSIYFCVNNDEVKINSNFIEDFGADSLDHVELLMAVEDEFDMEIPDEEAEKIITVKDAIEYISGKVERP